ncbi:MAG: DUF2214 family protein [Pseudomonadota bacterium]
MTVFIAFLHHLAAFTLTASLVVELVLLQQEFNRATAKTLQLVDGIYGMSAGLILALGALRVIYFEKGAAYYLHNGPFLSKMALFVVVGLISVYPTVVFMRWRKTLKQGGVPAFSAQQRQRIKGILTLELIGIAGILLNAAMMAKGVQF